MSRKPGLRTRLSELAADMNGCPHADCRMGRQTVQDAAELLASLADLACEAAEGNYAADAALGSMLDDLR